MIHNLLTAVIRHGKDRPALRHERFSQPRHADQRIDRNLHRTDEAVTRTIRHAAMEIISWAVRDRMNEDVEPAPPCGDCREDSLHLTLCFHIERHQERCADTLCDRCHIGLRLFVHIGQRDFGARRAKSLRAAGGDGMRIRNTHHQRDFVFKKLHVCMT